MPPRPRYPQTSEPRASRDWQLACQDCKMIWSGDTAIEVMELHASMEHPEMETLSFDAVWIGKGPAPPHSPFDAPLNRAQKRHKARQERKRR